MEAKEEPRQGEERSAADADDNEVNIGSSESSADKDACSSEMNWMKKCLSLALAIVAGVLLVAQNGVNTNLRSHAVTAPLPAACTSFLVGFLVISFVAIAHTPRCGPTSLCKAPWYTFIGGPLGTSYVVCAICISSRVGFAAFQLCAITGQLLSGLMCDAVGLLHLRKRQPTVLRGIAVGATLIGAVLTSSEIEIKGRAFEVIIWCIASFSAGTIFPIQACVNAALKKYVLTPFRAVVVSFAGGFLTLFCASAFLEATSQQEFRVRHGEVWMWTGGVCGAIIVSCTVIGIPNIGAAAFSTVFLASQLTTAFVFDLIGAFGFKSIAFSASRCCGVLLAIGAAGLFQLESIPKASSSAESNRWGHQSDAREEGAVIGNTAPLTIISI
jgi:uncharacterized membrane protein YdcZ (DUF606 family)